MSTKPNRELFIAHLKYWKEALHLGAYRISSSYDYEGTGGECEMNHESLTAIIRIGDVDEVYTEAIVARHEMLELLLEPLHALTWENVGNKWAYRAGHEVIHRLENIMPIPTDAEVGYVSKKKKKAKKEKDMACGGKKKKPKGK